MKVLFIYRHPDMGFSIGKVFKPIEEEMRKYAEVDAVYLPVPNYSLKGLWQNIRAARRAAKAKQYDIVHITGAEHYLIPFLRGQRVVVTVHDMGFCTILKHKLTYKIKFYLFVTSLKKASLVTFISEKSQQEAKQFVQLNPNKSVVVYNPVGQEFQANPKEFNAQCPTILHIGTKEHKNLDRSIEALAGIPCNLRIIGAIGKEQEMRMNELEINYSVGTGLSDAQILQEYENADIINFPSLYEGFGMPIIEGQAVGRIVITSSREPMETIAGKEGALLVNPEDESSIRNAYLTAIQSKEERERIIANGTENVKKYQLKDIAYLYYSQYLSILPPPIN